MITVRSLCIIFITAIVTNALLVLIICIRIDGCGISIRVAALFVMAVGLLCDAPLKAVAKGSKILSFLFRII